MKRIAERVAAFRQLEGLSQRKLADKAGISAVTLNRIEQGCDASLSTIIKIENALGHKLF